MDAVDQLLDRRNAIWRCAQSKTLDLGQLLITIKMLQKSLRILANFKELDLRVVEELVVKMTDEITFSSGKTMKLLWQRLHPITLSSRALFNLEEELCSVARKLDAYSVQAKGE